jgi:AhpD family alkylhydroperoxidase
MTPRLDSQKIGPPAYDALASLESYLRKTAFGRPLVNLVKLRASQINGCAYCIDMHWKDARAEDESEQRLYGLAAWREAPYYSDRERAALEWTEAVTRIGETHAPDGTYEAVRHQFSEKDLVDLTYVVVAINAWNRLATAFRMEAGSYQSTRPATTSA